jgi:hypothetical protein
MLQKQGRRMMHVSSLDRNLLEEAVDRIVREATSWDERPIRPSIHLSRSDALPEALDAQF